MSFEELLVSLIAEATGDKELGNQLYTGEGEDKKPISNDQAKKLVKEKIESKFKNLGKIDDEKKLEIEKNARKSVYEKLEGDIKTKHGIEVQIQKDGFTPVINHVKDQFKNEKIDPADAKKSPEYIALKKELTDEKKGRAEDLQKSNQARIMDHVHFGMPALLEESEFNFVKPTNKGVLENNLLYAQKALIREDVQYAWNENKTGVIVTDKNGHPLTDDSGNEIGLKQFQLNALKTTFDVNANSQRGSAAAGDQNRQMSNSSSSIRSTTFRNSEGQDQSYSLPSNVKTKSEGQNWYAGNVSQFKTTEERDAAAQLVEELPESA